MFTYIIFHCFDFHTNLGDEKGAVLVWDYVQKVCNAWTPLQSMVTHLVTSPHSPEVTAIGLVVNILELHFICLKNTAFKYRVIANKFNN